jgi:hypothetical protein
MPQFGSAFVLCLPHTGNAISAKGYYIVAVTDWSLFILSRSGGMKDGYQLEVPLLALKDLVSTRGAY